MAAVNIKLEDALVAARIVADGGDVPPAVLAAAGVHFGAASVIIERHAPEAPEAIANAAAVRMLAYLWALEDGARARGYTSALRESGAVGMLAAWRVKRAGIIDPDEGAIAPTPSGSGGPGVDAVARAEAAEAASTARQALLAAGRASDAASDNTGFLSTFMERVAGIVAQLVPQWARQPQPPDGADPAATWAREAPHNQDDQGDRVYPKASDLATDRDEDMVLSAAASDAVLWRAAREVPEGGNKGEALLRGDDDAYAWSPFSTGGLIKLVLDSTDRLAISRALGGSRSAGDVAIGYDGDKVRIFRQGENLHTTPLPLVSWPLLPAFAQAATLVLQSKAGALFWEAVNAVPDTPGEATGVGHVLSVTGENDQDYAWRGLPALLELATGGGLEFDGKGALKTTPSLVAAAAEADANKLAIAAEETARGDADTALGVRIDGEATARERADTALGVRIDTLGASGLTDKQRQELEQTILANIDTIQLRPNYWVKGQSELFTNYVVHLHSGAVPSGTTHIHLKIHGGAADEFKQYAASDEDYEFQIDEPTAATIDRAIGSQATVQAEVLYLDRSGAGPGAEGRILETRRFLLRVLDAVPTDAGAVALDVTALATRVKALELYKRLPSNPTDGQLAAWDRATGAWKAVDAPSSGLTYERLLAKRAAVGQRWDWGQTGQLTMRRAFESGKRNFMVCITQASVTFCAQANFVFPEAVAVGESYGYRVHGEGLTSSNTGGSVYLNWDARSGRESLQAGYLNGAMYTRPSAEVWAA